MLNGPVEQLAPSLLGAVVRAGPVAIRLTEVEAYAGADDAGSHAFRGQTPRNAVMFGPAGRAYVYFTYGMHWCLNVVTGPAGEPAAVLLRAGEVISGLDLARTRRPGSSDRDLARGPARMTKTLGVDGRCNGLDLIASTSELVLEPAHAAASDVRIGPRVGVAGAGAARPWRFWLDGEPTVSTYRPAVTRSRTTGATT
ncbi:MAG: DNA-3-methyladenine glycosylase [Mycobacteriales bacterium]